MPSSRDEQQQVADALNNLAAAVDHMQLRYDAAQRANRRMRVALFFATLIILGGAIYLTLSPLVDLLPRIAPQRMADVDPEAAEAERQRLIASLPAEERSRIERFEEQIKWVSDYMDVYTDFRPGAAITLFLAKMNDSVQVMPAMYAEVRSMQQEMQSIDHEIRTMNEKMDALPALANDVQGMNGKMNALPILATEVQGIHAQMAVMSTNMDSTMGRAGRMMPWMP